MTRTTSVLVTGMLAIGLILALGTSARAEDEPTPSLTTLMERLTKLEAENAKLHARIKQLETRPNRRPGRHQGPPPRSAEGAVDDPAGQRPVGETERPEDRRPGSRRADRGPRQAGPGRAQSRSGQRGPRGPGMRGPNQDGPRGPDMRGPGQRPRPGPGGPGNTVDARLTRIEHMLHQLLGQRGPAEGQGRRDGRPRGPHARRAGPDGPEAPRPPTQARPPLPKKVAPPIGDDGAPAPVPAAEDEDE